MAKTLILEQPRQDVVEGVVTPKTARSIIESARSPFCPGLTLAACPSPSADSLRRVIIARVQQGDSRETIESELVRDFGSAIRFVPETSGFGLVAWVMPALILIVGGIGIARWIRRRVRVP